jgi:hypothetical protein
MNQETGAIEDQILFFYYRFGSTESFSVGRSTSTSSMAMGVLLKPSAEQATGEKS